MKQNRRMFFGSVVFHSKHETHDTKYDGHLFLQFLSYESYIQSVAQPFQLAEFFFTPKVWNLWHFASPKPCRYREVSMRTAATASPRQPLRLLRISMGIGRIYLATL